jgi:hypothetical protein
MIPALPLLLETEFILSLWLGDLPPYAATLTRLTIINVMIHHLGGVDAITAAVGKIKYFQIVLSTLSLLSIPVSVFLFKLGFFPPTILYIFLISSLINLVFSLLLLKKLINFNVLHYINLVHKRIFYVFILVGWLFFVKEYFEEGWMRFAMMVFSSLIILGVSIYMVGLEQREKVIVSLYYREFLLKFSKQLRK